MLKKRQLLTIFAGVLLFSILAGQLVNASELTQWFPEEEPQIDYTISHNVNFSNGTGAPTKIFDVFRSISGTSYYLRPTQLRNYFTPSSTTDSLISLSNNTEVTYRVTYQNENSTHLSKTKKVVWNTGESNESIVTLTLIIFDSVPFTTTKTFVFTEEYVHRNDFSIATNVFLDFINRDLGIGDYLGMEGYYHEYMAIVAITSDTIIAFSLSAGSSNSTYICSRDGKTISYSAAFSSSTLTSVLISTVSIGFTAMDSSGGFFDKIPWTWVLLGTTVIELMIIVLVSVKKKRGK